MARRSRLALLAGVLVAVGVAAVLFRSPTQVLSAVAALETRPVLFVLALCGLYLVRPALVWPVAPISVLVGFVLGPVVGVPVALAGAVLTAVPPYLLARRFDDVGGPLGRLAGAGEDAVAVTGDLRGVLAARLSPVPADPVSYGAGVANVSPRAFLVGTLVGEIPWVVLEVLAGASMRQLTVKGLGSRLDVVLALAVVAAAMVAGPVYRHLSGGTPQPEAVDS